MHQVVSIFRIIGRGILFLILEVLPALIRV
jgi:hypothetical protein